MGKTGCHRHPSCDRLAVMMVTACQLGTASPKLMPKLPKRKMPPKAKAATPGKTPRRTLKGGVQVEELKEGTGPEVKQDNLLVCTMRENPAPRTSSLMPRYLESPLSSRLDQAR